MRWITILNSENIYLGYDAALRRNILDVLDRNHISCRINGGPDPLEDCSSVTGRANPPITTFCTASMCTRMMPMRQCIC